MTTATLFQWVELKQDVPNSLVKAGNNGNVEYNARQTA
jgi:hypothetical protein